MQTTTKENIKQPTAEEFINFTSNFSSVSYSKNEIEAFLHRATESKKEINKKLGLDDDGRKIVPVSLQKAPDTLKRNMQNFFEEACGYTLYVNIKNNFTTEEAIENCLENDKEILTGRNETIKLGKGMKFSKAINKIMEKLRYSAEKRDYILTKYSQVLNEKTLTGKLVISTNPMDFYSMSVGESWSSCLSPDSDYSSGTFSYALDEKTFIAYLVSNSESPRESEIVNKKWRKLFILSSTLGETALLSSRGYPFDSQELSDFAVENIWSGLSEDKFKKHEFGKAFSLIGSKYATNSYSDFSLRNNCFLYLPESLAISEIPKSSIDASSGANYDCLSCGYGSVAPESGICAGCLGYSSCDDCGEIAYEEYYTANGLTICEGCADDYVCPADDQDSLYHFSEVQYVESIGDYVTNSSIEEEYDVCEDCKKIYHLDSMNTSKNGIVYCDDCFEESEDEED